MASGAIRGEGILFAVGVVLVASFVVAGVFVLRAFRSTATPVASTASVATPAPTPSVVDEPPPPTLPEPSATTPLARKRYAIDAGTEKPSAPRIRFGTLTISGRLPAAVVQRIIRQNFGRFRMCYEQALATTPALKGRLYVRFVIGRDGSVSNLANAGTDLPNATMIGCVIAAFAGLAFPTPEGGIVTVLTPLKFEPF